MKQAPVVVITGASAGIGRATATLFARRGWKVGLLARGQKGLESTARDIRQAGGEAMALAVDVADRDQVEAAADRIEEQLGPIRVWINNAMATLFCEFRHTAPEDFERATRVTYLGTVWGTQAALARMQPRDRGTIVQVGSALAYRSIPLQAAYCGAKSAIRGFTDSVRCELIHQRSGVHLSMVQLSAFNTPQFDWARNCGDRQAQPVPPIFQPEVAAKGIYWAAMHRRRELCIGWPAVKAILANRLAPGLLDRHLARAAYSDQHTDAPLPAGRADNLYESAGTDPGAHGRFDARTVSPGHQPWLTTHRRSIGGTLAIGVAIAAWRMLRSRRRGNPDRSSHPQRNS